MEVLHASVGNSEFHYCFEFFGNDSFVRIREQVRARKIQKCRIVCFDGPGVMVSPKPISIWMGI